jgi:hypothetical protein
MLAADWYKTTMENKICKEKMALVEKNWVGEKKENSWRPLRLGFSLISFLPVNKEPPLDMVYYPVCRNKAQFPHISTICRFN